MFCDFLDCSHVVCLYQKSVCKEYRTRLQSSATSFFMPDQRHFLSLYSYSLHGSVTWRPSLNGSLLKVLVRLAVILGIWNVYRKKDLTLIVDNIEIKKILSKIWNYWMHIFSLKKWYCEDDLKILKYDDFQVVFSLEYGLLMDYFMIYQ